jgi:hypothetical protein
VQGPCYNDEFGDTFGNVYAFTADGFDYAELRKFVDQARDEFLRVKDVARSVPGRAGRAHLRGTSPRACRRWASTRA